ncbi:MAG TPA: endo-1,4-beta-xylanase [Solirubrobacteraceae bacterium]|nr:endo-1,4-beta-xylanase [Solirubrobacteraceae bacterium]
MAGPGRRARQRVRRLLRAGRHRGAQAVALLALTAPAPAGAVELGAAINDAGFDHGGAQYRDTFAAHYDAATAESAMKMTALQPSRGTFEFGHADAIVDWARAEGKQVHGHVLVWCADEWSPGWLTGRSWTREELLEVMEDHIRTVMDHFEGRVETWDVVNEALADDGSRRDCVWQRHIGDDWVAQAFRFARAADPRARLFYNEYRADWPNPKFDALLALVAGLDLDGVGLQHHTYGFAPLQEEVEDAIARVAALGLRVHVSELNVTTSQIGGDLARQAQAYWTIAAACAAQPACFRVTTWGFTDRYGWRPPSELAMPFDVDYRPKPAWEALRRGLGRETGPLLAAPGPPAVAGDRIAWPPVEGARYALQHRDARGTWRTLASGIPVPELTLFEREGTWEYRVRAEDGPWSQPSAPAKVDRTPPGAPTVPAGWLRAPASVQLLAGDPPLPDGSPGSGVEPPPPQLFTASGVLRGSVRDRAGNVSPEGGGEVRVDGAPPAAALTCPRRVVRGGGAVGRWTASDVESGLAGPASGTVPLTGRRAEVTVRDVAGHVATARCAFAVVAPLRLYTRSALLRDGAVRLRVGCRLARCRSVLTLRRGARTVGRSRAVTVRGARTVGVPTRARGRLVVTAGRDRLGVVQTRRSMIQRDVASRRSIG